MTSPLPPEPSAAHDEKALLEEFLDHYRAVMVRKVEGVVAVEARRPRTPSGVSLLGLVHHLLDVERWWFRDVLAGEQPAYEWEAEGRTAWQLTEADTVETVCDAYRAEIEHSRRIAAGMALEEAAARPDQEGAVRTLRWVLVHMIEETARHAGHADILREQLDGAVGD